jgi:hypothetical protein
MPDAWNANHGCGNTLAGKVEAMQTQMGITEDLVLDAEHSCRVGDWGFLRKVTQTDIMRKALAKRGNATQTAFSHLIVETKDCYGCHQKVKREDYSKEQFRNPDALRRCKPCEATETTGEEPRVSHVHVEKPHKEKAINLKEARAGDLVVETKDCHACNHKVSRRDYTVEQWRLPIPNRRCNRCIQKDVPVRLVCSACDKRATCQAYFCNHWDMPNGEWRRCRSCVISSDPKGVKSPSYIMAELGWIELVANAIPAEYTPARIGKLIMERSAGFRDATLHNLSLYGFHGYGGVKEGLCLHPGCVEDQNLKNCHRCQKAQYCCRQHQEDHWPLHKVDCKEEKGTQPAVKSVTAKADERNESHTAKDKTETKKGKKNICAMCSALGDQMKLCAKCKQVRYCSAACQKAHWKVHKVDCKKFQTPAPAFAPVPSADGDSCGGGGGGGNDVDEECSICLELLSSSPCVLLHCSHRLHRTCVRDLRKHGVTKRSTCPLCRTPLPSGALEIYDKAVRMLVRAERTADGRLQEQLLKETEVLLKLAIEEDDSHSQIHCSLAYVLGQLGDNNGEVECYKQAIILKDDRSSLGGSGLLQEGAGAAATVGLVSTFAYPEFEVADGSGLVQAKEALTTLADESLPLQERLIPLDDQVFDSDEFTAVAERQTPSIWHVASALFDEDARCLLQRAREGVLVSLSNHFLSTVMRGSRNEDTSDGSFNHACPDRCMAMFATGELAYTRARTTPTPTHSHTRTHTQAP